MEYSSFPEKTRYRKFSLWKVALEFVFETIKILVFSLAIIIPVRYFLIQPFYVKGASMEPNYLDHDYLIINEANFRVLKRSPERGEVVVFRYPRDPKQFFIKRIIGLPGEEIEIKDGEVIVYNARSSEGLVLDESAYLADEEHTTTNKGSLKIKLEAQEYFVMGDNRGASLDSRAFGPIHYDAIVGKTWIRGFPFQRITTFESPEYNFE